jgi:hypothetical protein
MIAWSSANALLLISPLRCLFPFGASATQRANVSLLLQSGW